MALSDRIPYQAQVDRPKLTLPGGKKLAVWVILNVEEWRIENAMPRTVLSPPMGQPLLARRAELVVARIRHAGGLLATVQGADRSQHAGHVGVECQCLQFLSTRCLRRPRSRL